MRSKLFEEKLKTVKTSLDRWVRILPDIGEGYALIEAVEGAAIGRILIDAEDNWVYDGRVLQVLEQEEVAGTITGNQKEMDELIRGL